jgi:hypothetical protein
MGINETYDLLLSKSWMKRVRAVEDHADDTMLIRGRNGHEVQVSKFQHLAQRLRASKSKMEARTMTCVKENWKQRRL